MAATVLLTLPPSGEASTPGRLAFNAGLYKAFVTDLDGRAPRELPLPSLATAATSTPSWSPDASRLAYGVSSCLDEVEQSVLGDCLARQAELVVVPVSGRSVKQVAAMPGMHIHAVDWSSDGDRIVLEVAGAIAPSVLMLASVKATGLVLLTAGEHPSWSPDGRSLVYVNPVDRAVYVLEAVGDGSPVRVSPLGVVAGVTRQWTGPVWSPEGRRIAFVGSRAEYVGDPAEVWVVDRTGSGGSPVPRSAGAYFAPSWSPDGTRLAYSDEAGIWVTRLDGSGRRRLVANYFTSASGPARVSIGPSWSPDGRVIAFLHTDQGAMLRDRRWIKVIRPDGSGARIVAPLGGWPDANDPARTANPPLRWAPLP